MNAELQRYYCGDDNIIIGNLNIYDRKELIFSCRTLENFGKRIKTGKYILVYNYSPKFDRDLYLVNGDHTRQGIRIHNGNRVKDTSGCILVGATFTKDTEEIPMITHSVYTLNELHRVTKGRPMEMVVNNIILKPLRNA